MPHINLKDMFSVPRPISIGMSMGTAFGSAQLYKELSPTGSLRKVKVNLNVNGLSLVFPIIVSIL